MQIGSKALTWINKQLPREFTGFTLHSVTDAKREIDRGNERLLRTAEENWQLMIEQEDVERMFTNLRKVAIPTRVRLTLEEAGKLTAGRGGRRKCVTVMRDGKKFEGVKWGADPRNEDDRVVEFEMIIRVVEFDLAHNFGALGGTIYEQMGGCPIGGLLSAIYANIYCAFDERNFCARWSHVRHLFFGLRQMDDFIFVILLNQGSEEEMEELLKMRKDARYNLYTEGPQSGVENKISWLGKSTRVCAGMQLRVEDTGVVCRTHNKNEESIILHDEQRSHGTHPGLATKTMEYA